MAKSNTKSTTKSAPVTVAAVPAPKGAAAPAPAAAPKAESKAPAAFAGFTHPVTDTQIQHFINSMCGGNPARVGIVPLDNIKAGDAVPFLRKASGGRASIVNALLWGFANGHSGPVNLAGVYQHFKSKGLATQGYTDLRAVLNGGFSASSKTWAQPFAKLVVLEG